MHLDTFRYFLSVVEEKSISKAANKNHISQSALSQMIHKLEEDLDNKLLNRSNRGVELTVAGEIVLKHGINIIKNYDKLLTEINNYDSNQNRIIISGTSSLASYSLPCMMYKIKKNYPDFNYDLEAKSVADIIRDIKDDLSDFGFIDSDIEPDPELIFHKMGKERVVLIAKNDYPVKERIDVTELMDIELIMCTMNKKTCEHLDEALKLQASSLERLNVIFNADSLTAVKSSVLNGFGMAFVPYESIKMELYERNVKIIEVDGLNMDYDIYLVSKKVKRLSHSSKESRDYLIEIGMKSFC